MTTREKFYAEHARCPQCFSINVERARAEVLDMPGTDFVDHVNRATCQDPDCGWSGKVSSLLHPRVIVAHNVVDRETGKTLKETNLELTHKIPIGALVELMPWTDEEHGGVRLYVVYHQRDCDGTPLYAMSATKSDTEPRREGFANPSWEHGWREENLMECDS